MAVTAFIIILSQSNWGYTRQLYLTLYLDLYLILYLVL
jgi:hypothetical protein